MQTRIIPYSPELRQQMLDVWERSVLATHDFLKPEDFKEIKELVATIDFSGFEVYCLMQEDKVRGFLGVADQKLEMLFLDPTSIGKGNGKKLLQFAVEKLNANKLDVNEQNSQAFAFYQKNGFKVYGRTDKDDQGRNYPLLRMKL